VQQQQQQQQQQRRRQFLRRQRRQATAGQPSSNSLDDLQRRTPTKLVQSSASLTSAPGGSDAAAAACCGNDGAMSTAGDASCRPRPRTSSVVVDMLPLQNGDRPRETPAAAAATTRTARSTATVDGGLRLPDARLQDPALQQHTARSIMTTTWLANKAQTVLGYPAARRARNAWSKSQEIHPKTGGGGGVCSTLRGSASATLISGRRRNSLHAVFVEDPTTALLKDVVISKH